MFDIIPDIFHEYRRYISQSHTSQTSYPQSFNIYPFTLLASPLTKNYSLKNCVYSDPFTYNLRDSLIDSVTDNPHSSGPRPIELSDETETKSGVRLATSSMDIPNTLINPINSAQTLSTLNGSSANLYEISSSPESSSSTAISECSSPLSDESSISLGSDIEEDPQLSQRKLDLQPTYFPEGCTCGHGIVYRQVYCSRRRNGKRQGITIKPKVQPLHMKFSCK